MLWRCVLATALSLTAAGGGLLVTGTAHAGTVKSGTLSFSGDSGDYISQGESWSYATSKGDALTATGSASGVSVSVTGYNGDWWTLNIDAPNRAITGQPARLAPGTYTGAHRYPFNGTGPGLDLSGEGRGCNELTGSFTITKAVFGSGGYIEAFDATFEQHCEGGEAAAHGKVHISNGPQPSAAAPKPAPTTSRRATTAKPHAAPTSRRPAHSATPGATPTGTPSASAAGIGTVAGDDSAGITPTPAAVVVSNTDGGPPLPFGVAVLDGIVLAGLLAVGLTAVGLVVAARRRRLAGAPGLPAPNPYPAPPTQVWGQPTQVWGYGGNFMR